MNESIADVDGTRAGATCRAAYDASVAMVTAAALNVADTAAAAARRARTVSSHPPPQPHAADQSGSR